MNWQQPKDKIHYHTVNKNLQELPNNLLDETKNVMAYDIYLSIWHQPTTIPTTGTKTELAKISNNLTLPKN